MPPKTRPPAGPKQAPAPAPAPEPEAGIQDLAQQVQELKDALAQSQQEFQALQAQQQKAQVLAQQQAQLLAQQQAQAQAQALAQQQQAQALAQQQAQQQQNQVNPPPPVAPVAFAVDPAAALPGTIDFASKAGAAFHKKTVSSLYVDPSERYDLGREGLQTFIDRVHDRAMSSNLSVVQVPESIAVVGQAGAQRKNFCLSHGEIPKELVTAFSNTYLGTQTRAAQDDNMLKTLLLASISEEAYATVMSDRQDFQIQGVECGLLLLKVILDHSSAETTVDPDLIRTQLSQAPAKFAELNYDFPSFNQWINTQVGKLRQRGETSSDLRSHIQSAYVSSNNPKLVTYVEQQKDYVRDNPSSIQSHLNPEPPASRVVRRTTTKFLQRNL